MILVIGLGNPGKKFEKTWHNLGFQIVNYFARKKKFPSFKLSKKFNSLISRGKLNKKRILLVKPQTFMNKSGKAVKTLTTFYKITNLGLVVIHDDIDLPLGKIRIIKNRGAAGHKGVQSIIDELGTKNFVRFRIGIRPNNKATKPFSHRAIESFVLQIFEKEEEKILKEVIEKTCLAIKMTITGEIEKAMQEFNE